MYWWKVEHVLSYHGEIISETRFILALNIENVIETMKMNIHPDRVSFNLNSIKFTKVSDSEVERDKVWAEPLDKGKILRGKLVKIALEWQNAIGVAPAVTSAISELDASVLVDCTYNEYCKDGINKTAVTKGYDFIYRDIRYQVKACRPSGKKGSNITRVPKAHILKNEKEYRWDKLICILYDVNYDLLEAWMWNASEYRNEFEMKDIITPNDMRRGIELDISNI